VKRGRGRPRKGEVVAKVDKTPKKRGRPKISQSEEDPARKKQKTDHPKKKKEEDKHKGGKSKSKSKQKEKKKENQESRIEKKSDESRFPYRINISVGAEESTGPGFYSVTVMKSTLSFEELITAYAVGSAKIGFDFQKEICTSNLNCSLTADQFKLLVSHGIPVLDDGNGEDQDLDFELTLESYRDIWFHIARIGNPLLNWAVADLDALPIGGNGLFQDLLSEKPAATVDTEVKKKQETQPE